MADITITAASVLQSSAASISTGVAGVAITAGQALYKDAADSNKLKLADDDNTAATAEIVGIALNGAAAGQPLAYLTADTDLAIGGTTVAGTIYVLSDVAGAICPWADKASGDRLVLIGIGKAANKMRLLLLNTGITL